MRFLAEASAPPERIAELLPDLDLLLVPSRPTATWNEPTGLTLLEAMAHEVSVIGTRAGVLPELIGSAGLITPPNDAESLRDAIGQMFNPEVRTTLARSARARSLELYSDDAVAEQTMAFWGRVARKS